jgi:hypothetical protein
VVANDSRTIPGPLAPVAARLDDIVLVTDATLHSFGVVLYVAGQVVEAYGGSFAVAAASMAAAESAAVVAAVTRFEVELSHKSFVLLVDNSTVEHALRRGKAKDLAVDLAVDTIVTILTRISAHALIARVSSADNVADAPSRSRPLKQACIDASLTTAHQVASRLLHTSVWVRATELMQMPQLPASG